MKEEAAKIDALAGSGERAGVPHIKDLKKEA